MNLTKKLFDKRKFLQSFQVLYSILSNTSVVFCRRLQTQTDESNKVNKFTAFDLKRFHRAMKTRVIKKTDACT